MANQRFLQPSHKLLLSLPLLLAACTGSGRTSGQPERLDAGVDGGSPPALLDGGGPEASRPVDADATTVPPASDGNTVQPAADASSRQEDARARDQDAQPATDAGRDANLCRPSTEECNKRDDDCDGVVDDGCVEGLTVLDFDISAQGEVVAVGRAADGLPRIVCLHADGSLARETQIIAAPELGQTPKSDMSPPTLAGIDVARARAAGTIAVTWSFWNFPATVNDWRVYVAFYDAQCNRVREPAALDRDLPNAVDASAPAALIAREADVFMTDDGRSYFLYEHQSAGQFRALVFDASGMRTAAISINTSTECALGARTRVLSVDATSGKFAVACESPATNERVVRRYTAEGTAVDPTFVAVPDSKPTGFTFHYFGLGLNASGSILYYGRTSNGTLSNGVGDPPKWILRGRDGVGQWSQAELGGTMGVGDPRTRVTSRGDFLIELGGLNHQLALVSPSGAILQTFPRSPTSFELDAEDRVWVYDDDRVSPSDAFGLYP